MSKTKRQTKNWKEKRRLHAVKRKRAGWRQKEIAPALDVSPMAVSQWIRKMEEEGISSLRSRHHTGRT